jgi:hypothetical protein
MQKILNLSKSCKEFFTRQADAISIKTGFIKRKRKLTGSAFLKSLIFAYLQDPSCSINVICQWLNEDSISISEISAFGVRRRA